MSMAPGIARELEALHLPDDPIFVTQDQIKALWDLLADISCNYDEEGTSLLEIEGVPWSRTSPCLDEDFWIWARGTPQGEVWEWFDQMYETGIIHLWLDPVTEYDPPRTSLVAYPHQEQAG